MVAAETRMKKQKAEEMAVKEGFGKKTKSIWQKNKEKNKMTVYTVIHSRDILVPYRFVPDETPPTPPPPTNRRFAWCLCSRHQEIDEQKHSLMQLERRKPQQKQPLILLYPMPPPLPTIVSAETQGRIMRKWQILIRIDCSRCLPGR